MYAEGGAGERERWSEGGIERERSESEGRGKGEGKGKRERASRGDRPRAVRIRALRPSQSLCLSGGSTSVMKQR